MAPSTLTKAIGAVKDQTSISLAKVGSLCDLDIAIVKATRHEEFPAEERHIREILSLTCYSRAYVSACVATISRRLGKTKNWVVALKTLILIQRLLAEGDPALEQEIFFATRRGTRLLNMSDFRDTRRKDSWDYSAFARTYALFLDEKLVYRMQRKRDTHNVYGEDEEGGAAPVRATPAREMRIEELFLGVRHLMFLMKRFLACHPTGSAKHNRIVLMALYPIVKESFQIYYDITETLSILIDRFVALEVSDCVKVYEIFCCLSKQFNELDEFYGWCKNVGIARSSEYPEVEKITQKKLDVMDEFIRDKSMSGHDRRVAYVEQTHETDEEDKESEIVEEDMNAIKALPPPEVFTEEPEKKEKEEEEEEPEPKEKDNTTQKEADLLNLGEDAVTIEEHGDKLALALFDGGAPATRPETTTTTAWEAFKDTDDWEASLVQSASHLANQKPSLPGGFDTVLLDGMYQQGAITHTAASSGYNATGSASSVAFGSAGRPAMLALPAPPAAGGGEVATGSADPFAASLPVPPPSYVQMSEMEKKQRLLVEEQLMWQQYARDRMPGQVGLAKTQSNPYPYNTGGYTQTY